MKRLLSVCLALVIAVPGLLGGEKPRFRRDAPPALQAASEAALFEVDFCHSPVVWPVAICFPDEWQKPISGMDGALVYPVPEREGPHSLLVTSTVVSASLEGLKKGVTRQRLRDPRIPIVETLLKYRRSDAFLRCTTFSVAPAPERRLPVYVPGPGDSVKIESTTNPRLLPGWGRPAVPCIDAFRNIVAGFTCHVGYRFRVAQGAVHDVAFGFMESHHDAAGMRVIDLFIENENVLTVDLIADIGRHKAAAFVFEARDLDGDGFVSVDVKPAPASRDRYPILNALWVFRRGAAPPPELLVRGEAGRAPLGMVDCGGAAASMEKPSPGPPCADLMLLEKGAGAGAIRVTVYSYSPEQPFAEAGGRCLFLSGRCFLSASAPWERVEVSPCSLSRWFVVLTFPEEVREVALYCASGHEAGDVDLQWAKAEEERAASRWNSLDLPCGAIRVPDGNIQALLHASIRGILPGPHR